MITFPPKLASSPVFPSSVISVVIITTPHSEVNTAASQLYCVQLILLTASHFRNSGEALSTDFQNYDNSSISGPAFHLASLHLIAANYSPSWLPTLDFAFKTMSVSCLQTIDDSIIQWNKSSFTSQSDPNLFSQLTSSPTRCPQMLTGYSQSVS